nr:MULTISPECIES: hypothetical protein [unclassified Anaeromyxobacter]
MAGLGHRVAHEAALGDVEEKRAHRAEVLRRAREVCVPARPLGVRVHVRSASRGPHGDAFGKRPGPEGRGAARLGERSEPIGDARGADVVKLVRDGVLDDRWIGSVRAHGEEDCGVRGELEHEAVRLHHEVDGRAQPGAGGEIPARSLCGRREIRLLPCCEAPLEFGPPSSSASDVTNARNSASVNGLHSVSRRSSRT